MRSKGEMKNVMKPISSHIICAASRSREHKLPQLCGNSVVQRYFPTYFWTALYRNQRHKSDKIIPASLSPARLEFAFNF